MAKSPGMHHIHTKPLSMWNLRPVDMKLLSVTFVNMFETEIQTQY